MRWFAAIVLGLASCALEPIELEGKRCAESCPADYVCVDQRCTRELSADGGGRADAGLHDSGDGDGGLVEDYRVLTVSEDSDDAFWRGDFAPPDREQLSVDHGGVSIEVGSGDPYLAAGLRFLSPLPRGARVVDARLELKRLTGGAPEDATMKVQLYQSVEVPPFDSSHIHPPEFHAVGGLSEPIGGWVADWGEMSSPNLAEPLQTLVERADYEPGAAIGFVITAENFPADIWAGFEDSSAGDGAAPRLKLRWQYEP